jgi:argininosuccinate lyase
VESFTASIGVDARLWEADIRGSVAHARMLGAVGVLTSEESQTLVSGLETVRAAITEGRVAFAPLAEDIHTEIERLLHEGVGLVAGKLHTARSRNDQVATSLRLYLRGECDEMTHEIHALQQWLCGAAEQHIQTLLPGFTHLQHAQPVSLGHHLLAYFWMLDRDRERIAQARARINRMPLGAAALAGTPFPIDRGMTARELGFEEPIPNSMDAVSDRDFVVELLSACALVMAHLSRLAEELILWSTPEIGFVELDDGVTTGSSIMPQKKNPDAAELVRGRAGKVYGDLVGALTMLKGLPLTYNRDLQEDKGFVFDGVDTARACLRITGLMLRGAHFDAERMADAARDDFSNATELADALARKGMPFREAHAVAGKVVRRCLEQGKALESLSLAELREHSSLFDEAVVAALQPAAVMAARTSSGGTAPAAVREQIRLARERLAAVELR